MSRRHHIAHQLERYNDVRSILVAMKNIALMEIHKLGAQIDRQNKLLDTVAHVAADFSSFYPVSLHSSVTLCIAIGTERGFCGAFNTELLAPLQAARGRGEEILIIGARLAGRLGEQEMSGGNDIEVLPGATAIEEIPAALEQVASWLERRQAQIPDMPLGVKVLYQEEGGPAVKIVSPLPLPEKMAKLYTQKPYLTLEPPAFLTALAEQALLLSLEGYFSLSLAAENHRRLEHMDGALRRLDERTSALVRRMNAARQEDIIQEIETILLGSGGQGAFTV